MVLKMGNPYGYKVCYQEEDSKQLIRHFKTYTLNDAKKARAFYRKYNTYSREDNHLLIKPRWVIIPISRSEVRAGIWREDPF